MRKQIGLHFYINIINFNQIITDEESKTTTVTHSIHALDTFFSCVESYSKRLSSKLIIEKITGSRLHMYILDDLLPSFQVVKAVSVYAYKLAQYINSEIPKYKSLLDFNINIGVAYGRFYEFDYNINDNISELTTIGYSANFAAKLQALSGTNKISISEKIYNHIPIEERDLYIRVNEESIKKYDQDCYFTCHLTKINSPILISDSELIKAREYANSDNLKDIEFTGVRVPLSFSNLSKTQCKELDGIPVFADVRGFTSQFDENDSNLEEMAYKTQSILASMYKACTNHGGIHIQFQGDRELALFHNVPEHTLNGVLQPEMKCFKSAVLASMRMIDEVKNHSVHIGVGADFGRLFATKIGARNEKDNILLGETVIKADIMEDLNAGEDQVAITPEVYIGLKNEDNYLANKFKRVGNYYITTIGYKEYLQNASYRQQSKNTSQNNYNGAWRKNI